MTSKRKSKIEIRNWKLATIFEFRFSVFPGSSPVTRHLSPSYGFTPSLRRKVIIGHQFVKADWSRLSPTKAVKRYHFGLTQ